MPFNDPEHLDRFCLRCGKTEPGWLYNRCPNCGEMADDAISTEDAKDAEIAALKAELEQERTASDATIANLIKELAEAKAALENCNECAKALAQARQDMLTERDEAKAQVEALQQYVVAVAESAERSNRTLREDRSEVFRMVTESEMQCTDLQNDGECGDIDQCLFHSLLRKCAALAEPPSDLTKENT